MLEKPENHPFLGNVSKDKGFERLILEMSEDNAIKADFENLMISNEQLARDILSYVILKEGVNVMKHGLLKKHTK